VGCSLIVILTVAAETLNDAFQYSVVCSGRSWNTDLLVQDIAVRYPMVCSCGEVYSDYEILLKRNSAYTILSTQSGIEFPSSLYICAMSEVPYL
jgi:hypothetical protein